MAHRFAMVYPERVKGVVILAAGTYTLPLREAAVGGETVALRYPLGAADLRERFGRDLDLDALRRVPFWIGVGAEDRGTGLPALWTPLLGDGRVERAHRFAAALQSQAIPVHVAEFPGVGHDVGEAERDAALGFISTLP
jgi:pimeloyl-ACP methyl ester carboxylesterase